LKNVKSIAIGGFDGMHIAHQELFSQLDNKHGAIVVVETGHANMTPGMQRQNFTHHPIHIYELLTIKHLDAEGFVKQLLEDFPALEHIVVGYDFHFGKDRAYDASDLEQFFKGKVSVVSEVFHDGLSVHSHIIREHIKQADLVTVKHLLGRNYSVQGSVVKGQGLGKKALVPTINVVTDQLLPKEGVYSTLTRINDEVGFHPSVTFFGHRVCTDNSVALETHLIGQEVGVVKRVEIAFLSFIRENQKFESLALLKEAIDEDIAKTSRQLQKLSL
jgi:riboflavin kinase/FMN adenylyltransferase